MSWLAARGLSLAGGRIFGPPGFAWRPDRAEGWNAGGERLWLAPEGLLNYEDPDRIVETYRVDPGLDAGLDPGPWQREGDSLVARMDLTLTRGQGRCPAEVIRRLSPLQDWPGYRQDITVNADLPLVPWVIRQLPPGFAVDLAQSRPSEGVRIFGDPPAGTLAPGRLWRADFSGEGFYKTAYPAASLCPWALLAHRPGLALLWHIARPAGALCPEHPPTRPECQGLGLSLFYDHGRFGHYGEIEAYGHLVAGEGRLTLLSVFLTGPQALAQATEISSTPIS